MKRQETVDVSRPVTYQKSVNGLQMLMKVLDHIPQLGLKSRAPTTPQGSSVPHHRSSYFRLPLHHKHKSQQTRSQGFERPRDASPANHHTAQEKSPSFRHVVSFSRRNERPESDRRLSLPPGRSFLCCKRTTCLQDRIFLVPPRQIFPRCSIGYVCLTHSLSSLC